jgi:hypothetical protein
MIGGIRRHAQSALDIARNIHDLAVGSNHEISLKLKGERRKAEICMSPALRLYCL